MKKNNPSKSAEDKPNTNVTDEPEKSDEGDIINVESQGGEDPGQNKTQTQGDAKTDHKKCGGDSVKGQSGASGIQKGASSDQEKGATATKGVASATISDTRKRGRTEGPVYGGSSSSGASGSKAKKKGEMDVPSSAPTCYVCQKPFASWKGVFGHLRAHRRQTPGAFPPPTFTPPHGSPEKTTDDKALALKEQMAPTLLNLARETMQKMNQDSSSIITSTVGEGVASSSRRGLDIDLNEPSTSVLLDFDLNNPAQSVKNDDNDDDGNDDDDDDVQN